MVFAVVPDDVTIEKVTGPEKRALDEYLGRETKKSIFEQIAANENVPLVIGGVALLASLPILYNLFLQSLEEQNVILSDKQKDTLKKAYELNLLVSPLGPNIAGKKVAKSLFELDLGDIEKKFSRYV